MAGVKLADRTGLIEESVTIALNAKAKQLQQDGRTIYNFTAGELDAKTPEYIQSYVANKLDLNKYTPTAGLNELRRLIAEHNNKFYGFNWIKPQNVVVTSGAKPAIYASLLSIINPGDEVILPKPAWVSYIDLIKLAGGKPVLVELDKNYDLNVDVITGTISNKTRLIILTSPHNPTGAILTEAKIRQLSEHLKETDIYVMADEIYNKLTFDAKYYAVPRAGFKNLIIINGFSKSQAITGWRIGYVIAPQEIASACSALLSHINGNAPLISQYAGIAAMQRDDQPPAANLDHLKQNLKLTEAMLKNIKGLKTNTPGGAFYIYLDLREITDNTLKWCENLLDKYGVALVPGEAFLTPGFARLTYSGDTNSLKKGINQIKKMISEGSNA